MAGQALTLEQCDESSIPVVESMLDANGLPTEDVADQPGNFYLASVEDRRIGIGGLEVHGNTGLLRSLVVEANARGNGYGARLCSALEAKATAREVDSLYLLTTTAATFFAHEGYEDLARAEAPDPIRQTREFAELCSDAAVFMHKEL